MSDLPPAPAPEPRPLPVGRLLVGVFLVLLGVGWLLDALGAVDLDWDLVLPIGLIAVGGALALAGWQGQGRGGLIALGVVLTVVLTIGAVVRVPFGGGVGDRTERPRTIGAIPSRYELAVGKLTVDLTALRWQGEPPREIGVESAVGIGQLVVLVGPRFPCVSTHAEAGLGEVVVFGERQSGVSPEHRTQEVCAGVPQLKLEASVGLGQVEVRRG
jgi:hypothetical protein